MNQEVEKVFSSFSVSYDTIKDVQPCFIGHISRTFFVTAKTGEKEEKYVLQEMNEYVFPNIDVLMKNVMAVTSFLREKAKKRGEDEDRSTLRFLPAKDGKDYYRHTDGKAWRAYRFIDDATTYQACPSPDFFEEVGRSFGNFAKNLADFDAATLGEVIPKFHDTATRYQNFLKAVEKNQAGRKEKVRKEIEFLQARKDKCEAIVRMIEKGEIPLRVTHNDTKLNNVLMGEDGKGVCIIDLDTVMPGSVLYDFGDAIRFGASSAAEDETDLEKVFVDMTMFEAFAKGYVGELKGYITEKEIRAFPLGAYVITMETGMRFLTDYLDGDLYFHIQYPEQNLDRARNQFKLVADMETKEGEMNGIIAALLE